MNRLYRSKLIWYLISYVSALQEAQDIFGLEFALDDFDPDDDGLGQESDEDIENRDDSQRQARQRRKRKSGRKSIYDVRC